MSGWVAAVPNAIGVVLAGWFAYLARRAQTHGPESVAGGYSQLVADMRRQLDEAADMRSQLDEALRRLGALERERAERDRTIAMLTRQVAWLLERVPPQHRVEFREQFTADR